MLNPDETIVLVAAHGTDRVLMGFHPEPGNYKAYMPPGVALEAGEIWDFYCPLCHASLISYVDRDLCGIDMHNRGEKNRVYFSRTAGFCSIKKGRYSWKVTSCRPMTTAWE